MSGASLFLWCSFSVCRVINLYVFWSSVTKILPFLFLHAHPIFFLKAVKLVGSPGTLSQVWEETAPTPPLTLRGGLYLPSVSWAELILTEEQSSRYWCPHLLGSVLSLCEGVCVCVCACQRRPKDCVPYPRDLDPLPLPLIEKPLPLLKMWHSKMA